MTFDIKQTSGPAKQLKSSPRVQKAEADLIKCYRRWKSHGKPRDKTHKARKNFLVARSNFQKVERQEQNKTFIKTNNYLMHSSISNKNAVFAKMKSIRQEKPSHISKIETPVGIYLAEDILEGFAADSEGPGKGSLYRV